MTSRIIPLEILDHIFQEVDEPLDLLSFALASKWHAEVAQRYLPYSYIRCDVARLEVWDTFQKKPILARRVRRLEIVEEDSLLKSAAIIVPQSLLSNMDPGVGGPKSLQEYNKVYEHCIPQLLRALQEMHNLRRFHWLPCTGFARTVYFAGIVHDTLAKYCPNVQEMHVYVGEPCISTSCPGRAGPRPSCDYVLRTRMLCPFQNLSSVCLVLTSKMWHGQEGWTSFFDELMLNNPALENFHIERPDSGEWPDVDLNTLLYKARWPRLSRFSVRGHIRLLSMSLVPPNRDELMAPFLIRHPMLRSLQLRTYYGPQWSKERLGAVEDLPGLPRLQSLDIGGYLSLNGIPLSMLSSLEYLALHETPATDWLKFDLKDFGRLDALRHATSLKVLAVPPQILRTIKTLATVIPSLGRIQFLRDPTFQFKKGANETVPVNFAASKMKAFVLFKELSHLGGFLVAINPTAGGHRTFDKMLQGLANSTQLQFMEIFDELQEVPRWLEIERNEEGSYSGWHFVKDRTDLHYESWGNMLPGMSVLLPHRNRLGFSGRM
ncbi:hypothetical protein M422DRAFT_270610 [Sphaerobolus stellatus SS14]|uniref:F-box domain-containing protein n=1 Tax=Sphaerobolus stellatus (strain SS14) TaxID=990650 RepID=A0A0C9UGK0_SPHS4|nr:hypothetical protein M422DRAFT_270610 [Sphaerobolus stellatus SS14]